MMVQASIKTTETYAGLGKVKVAYELVLHNGSKTFLKRITKKEVGQLVALKLSRESVGR